MKDYQPLIEKITELVAGEIQKDPRLAENDFVRNIDGFIFDLFQRAGLESCEKIIQEEVKKKFNKGRPRDFISTNPNK